MNECIEWESSRNKKGYGTRRVDGKTQLAYRYAFFLEYGFYPEIVMHLCDNPPCINIDHLVRGDAYENQQDSVSKGRHFQAAKEKCKHGHIFDADNTYINPLTDARQCRTCKRNETRKRRANV